MYCRTETSWSYWSRGEASFLSHLSLMNSGNWTMLGSSGVLHLWNQDHYPMNPRVWCAWLEFEMRTCTLPTLFIGVVCLATGPTLRINFFLCGFALLDIFLFFFFSFLQSLQVISDVCPVESGVLDLEKEEVIVAIGRSFDSSRALSSSFLQMSNYLVI